MEVYSINSHILPYKSKKDPGSSINREKLFALRIIINHLKGKTQRRLIKT